MLGQLWILSMLLFILGWRHNSNSFSLKKCFCKFSCVFSCLGLTLNHKSMFWRSGDVTSPHSLLHEVILLSILTEKDVLVVPQEKLLFTIVSITLLWAQSKKTSFWGSDDVIMMSQAPRSKLRLGKGSFLLFDT